MREGLQARVAIYCRLSKEDAEKQTESESIQNQKALLLRYAAEQNWAVAGLFCDEDYSGADRDRPAFCRLLSEAEAHCFEIVLVKTQSRFTRDMELVERYLHGLFPLWGVRFVALLDHVDTALQGNKKARQINGLINEWYLEDLSENIRAVFAHKRRAGQYIGSFPLYGYQKAAHNKNQLIVDPEAARVVQRIFRLSLAGEGKQRIASRLNKEGIQNPTAYKQAQGLAYVNGGQRSETGLWSRTSVGRILREQMYTGDLVQGRRKKVGYKSKTLRNLPPEEWVIVPNTHEPIVDRATFASVQALLNARCKSDGSGIQHPLAGKLRCMDCGSAMVKVSNTYKGERRSYVRCKRHTQGASLCSSHALRLDALEEAVLTLIREYLLSVEEPERFLPVLQKQADECVAETRELARLTQERARREKALRELYLDKVQGVLDEVQFYSFQEAYQSEIESLQKRMESVQACLCTQPEEKGQDLQALLKETLCPLELTRELCALLVDYIELGERDLETGRQQIHIHWLW